MTNRSISAQEELELESSEWTLRDAPSRLESKETSKFDLEVEVDAGCDVGVAGVTVAKGVMREPEVTGVDSRNFLAGS